ncbi:hypothetical protein RCL1_005898 [Eukaryota sp. TZLM3-RCL]
MHNLLDDLQNAIDLLYFSYKALVSSTDADLVSSLAPQVLSSGEKISSVTSKLKILSKCQNLSKSHDISMYFGVSLPANCCITEQADTFLSFSITNIITFVLHFDSNLVVNKVEIPTDQDKISLLSRELVRIISPFVLGHHVSTGLSFLVKYHNIFMEKCFLCGRIMNGLEPSTFLPPLLFDEELGTFYHGCCGSSNSVSC